VTSPPVAPPPIGQGYPTRAVRRETGPLRWAQIGTVARTDLKQLLQAKDFWGPMVGLGAIFFCVVPLILLFSLTSIAGVQAVEQISQTLEVLPGRAQASIQAATGGDDATPQGQASYALAVFLFAPVAVVVPLTISTAVGAATIVGEREKGTGEFLAHSPAGVREIYLGKLLASLLPGYATTVVGFGVYSLIVNLIVGPEVGGWFFPTTQWWILMAWVVPPFLALTLSVVLRLSARVKSTAAAQQASGLVSLPLIMVAYSQSTGALFGGTHVTWIIGGIAWVLAITGLRRGMRAVSRARLLGVADEQ
jgi:ABC-2 type transport system permease protein